MTAKYVGGSSQTEVYRILANNRSMGKMTARQIHSLSKGLSFQSVSNSLTRLYRIKDVIKKAKVGKDIVWWVE